MFGHTLINAINDACLQLEMILQAHEYESAQRDLNLQEFFDSTEGKFKTQLGRSLAEEVIKRRQARLPG